MIESLKPKGTVEIIIEENGEKRHLHFKNTILELGREALASCLAGPTDGVFITRMIFGDGGTTGGVPNIVDTGRNGLFGTTRANNTIISTIDPETPSQVIFTSVLTFNDANGYELTEMALVMDSGDLYSMVTFPALSKTALLQITINWTISFV